MKNDILIFDTNFYWVFYHNNLKGKNIETQNRIISELNSCEKKNNYSKKLNYFVLHEIIKHLLPTENNLRNFYEMLLFVYKHNYEAPKITKPHNMLIYELIHSKKHKEHQKKYNELKDLLKILCTTKLKTISTLYLEQEINIIADRIKNIKSVFASSLTMIFNNIIGNYNAAEKAKVKTEFKNYEPSAYEKLVKNIIAVEIDRKIIINEQQPMPSIKIYENNFFGLSLVIDYFNRVFNGSGNFNFNKRENANDIIDFLICHNIDRTDNTKLVTGEKKIINMFIRVGYPDKVIDANNYLQNIGFKLVGSEI